MNYYNDVTKILLEFAKTEGLEVVLSRTYTNEEIEENKKRFEELDKYLDNLKRFEEESKKSNIVIKNDIFYHLDNNFSY